MKKISAVYKVTNTISGEFYVGSSRDVKRRWARHKCPSSWKEQPNSRMYQDMQTYGTQAFRLEILAECPPEHLKIKEQEAIETLHPTYNSINAYTSNEDYKSKSRAYYKAYREAHKEKEKARARARQKTYREAHKEEIKAYQKTYRETHREELKAHAKAHREERKAYMKAYRLIRKELFRDEHLE